MKRKTIVYLMILSVVMIIISSVATSVAEDGLLPSLTETVGIAMPSLGEALLRYPDEETENEDGGVSELYKNISETDFGTFSVYLEQQEAELEDYKAENGIITAKIRVKDVCLSLEYNSQSSEVMVVYPKGTFDERKKTAEVLLDEAEQSLAEGRINEAYTILLSIPQYADYLPAVTLLNENDDLAAIAKAEEEFEVKMNQYKTVGNGVFFGTYPQTAEGTDQTPIEWIVLDYDTTKNRTLLISKYCLDMKPYNTSYSDTTWEYCTLRKWLNNDFLQKAFSTNEQKAILTTRVDNSSAQGYDKWDVKPDGGNNTQDKIFVLSYKEANRYLKVVYGGNNKKATAEPTEYAIAHGASPVEMADGVGTESWWLRSPGRKPNVAAYVNSQGNFSLCYVDGEISVRPVLWLDLNADIF